MVSSASAEGKAVWMAALRSAIERAVAEARALPPVTVRHRLSSDRMPGGAVVIACSLGVSPFPHSPSFYPILFVQAGRGQAPTQMPLWLNRDSRQLLREATRRRREKPWLTAIVAARTRARARTGTTRHRLPVTAAMGHPGSIRVVTMRSSRRLPRSHPTKAARGAGPRFAPPCPQSRRRLPQARTRPSPLARCRRCKSTKSTHASFAHGEIASCASLCASTQCFYLILRRCFVGSCLLLLFWAVVVAVTICWMF